jgi:hypothetical protein
MQAARPRQGAMSNDAVRRMLAAGVGRLFAGE